MYITIKAKKNNIVRTLFPTPLLSTFLPLNRYESAHGRKNVHIVHPRTDIIRLNGGTRGRHNTL